MISASALKSPPWLLQPHATVGLLNQFGWLTHQGQCPPPCLFDSVLSATMCFHRLCMFCVCLCSARKFSQSLGSDLPWAKLYKSGF